MHLYLLTLEIDPLVVGATYNPLPSHLTLVSRFHANVSADIIAKTLKPICDQVKPIQLVFKGEASIGPKKTPVYMVTQTAELKSLHTELMRALNSLNVTYAFPEFVGEHYMPHISKREGTIFMIGSNRTTNAAYLLEVGIRGKDHFRQVRTRFALGGV